MIQVCKLTEEALNIIKSADTPGKVHSVYHRVINIVMGNELVSIHPDTIGWTPMSMVLKISEDDFEALHICRNETVTVSLGKICIGEQCFRLENTEILRSTVMTEPAGGEYADMEMLLQKINEYIKKTKVRSGFHGGTDYVGSYLRNIYSDFKDSVESRPQEVILEKAVDFIGAGNGLTPSGDDFLVGLLFLLFLRGEKWKPFRNRLADKIKHNLHRTTDLSGAFLQYACQGKFSGYLLELEHLLIHKRDIAKSLEKIGRTGHSSGIDTLTGMAAGCMLCRR